MSELRVKIGQVEVSAPYPENASDDAIGHMLDKLARKVGDIPPPDIPTQRESVQLLRSENPDSIEIGTPSKGGAVKVYFDSGNVEAAQKKIEAAMKLRAYAQAQYEKKED